MLLKLISEKLKANVSWIILLFMSIIFLKDAANDLRANEGRETKALNCKPITNLKEKSELSNYSKTSGFRLHAVSGWQFSRLTVQPSFQFRHTLIIDSTMFSGCCQFHK